MKTFEKLAVRIEKDTGLKLDRFRRTYAGYWQRKAGAWRWFAFEVGSKGNDIGSMYSATELLKSKNKLLHRRFFHSDEIVIDH